MTLKVTKKYKVSQIHLVSFMTSRLAFLSVRPIMGLPDFCHFLRVVGNLIPPYLKHKRKGKPLLSQILQ